LRDAGDGVLAFAEKPERDPRRHTYRMGRLRVLERMGLAEETAPGMWRLAPDLEPTLRRMGERGDIIKTMHRELKAAGIERAASDHLIFDSASDGRVVGRLVAEGLSDELRERRYVIVDGVDGRTHYVELGLWNANDAPLVRNTIVELRAREIVPWAVDRTISEIASRNHGLYSIGLHGAVDPSASAEFIETHVRRLEAMRLQGLAERLPDGRWRVGLDHLDRAACFEEAIRSQRPVRMTVLSWQNLEALPGAVGATWLDRQLVAKAWRSRLQGWGPRSVRRFGRGGNGCSIRGSRVKRAFASSMRAICCKPWSVASLRRSARGSPAKPVLAMRRSSEATG
jgi:hypothetical protein